MTSFNSLDQSFYFICGLPRSGTTALVKNLEKSNPKILCFGESGYFGKNHLIIHNQKNKNLQFLPNTALRILNNKLKLKSLDPILLSSFSTIALTNSAQFYCEWIAELSRKEKKDYIFEKTPHHLKYIPRILSIFPNAKFLVTWRDPYSWLLSYKNQYIRFSGSLRFKHKIQYNSILAILNYLNAYNALINAYESFSGRVHLINNGDLSENTSDEIKKALKFISPNIKANSFEPVYSNSSFDIKNNPEHLKINEKQRSGSSPIFNKLTCFEHWLIYFLIRPKNNSSLVVTIPAQFNLKVLFSFLFCLVITPFQALILLILNINPKTPFTSIRNYTHYINAHSPFARR